MTRAARGGRILAALAALLALATCTARAQSRPSTLGDSPAVLVERAQVAYTQGRFRDALAAARRAAEAAPRSLPAQLIHAAMAEIMGEFEEAGHAYAQAQRLAPADDTTRYRVASFATRIGEYDRALHELDAILASQPDTAQLVFRWAPTFLQRPLLQYKPALARFVELQIDILLEKGDLEGARRLARRHAVVDPARDYCAEANHRKHTRGASHDIFRAFRLAALGQPTAADCLWSYGQWLTDEGYMRLGRLMVEEGTRVTTLVADKDAGERFVRVRLGGPHVVAKRAESLFMIAKQRYLRDGDVEGAARLFDDCLRMSPAFARVYSYKARLALDDADRERALRWLRRGTEADPESWRTWHNLGRLLLADERWAEARQALARSLELFPDDVGARLALARASYVEADWDGYRTHTRSAVDIARRADGADRVKEPAEFLAKFERWGPGAALPPIPDPPLILGWMED